MSPKKVKILLVEDDEDDYFIANMLMKQFEHITSYELEWVSNYQKAQEIIRTQSHHIYLFDYLLGKDSGLGLLIKLKQKQKDLPAIMLTGKGDVRVDRQAIELGAYDYLEKASLTADALERSIRYALKHAETLQALRESEMKYRLVVEHSKEIIFIANEDFNIVHISNAVESLTGFGRDEIYNMQSQNLFNDPMQMLKLQDEMIAKGSISDFMLEVKTKNGEVISGLLSCVLEKHNNNKFFIHGIFSDQTDRIRAEKAMLQSQKLHSTARLMQVLAHEVRNPLMNIQLSVGNLQDSLYAEDDCQLLAIIRRNAGRIDQLITEVLNAAAEKEVKMKATNLHEVIASALEQVQDRAQMQGVFIKTDLKPTPKLKMNAEQMTTALVNILVNGIEAMENQKDPSIEVISHLKNNQVVIVLKDNGIGMDSELQAKLFEPFYTAKTNGVGLGLATTLGILKAHNAHIEVLSELGKGSTFTISMKA